MFLEIRHASSPAGVPETNSPKPEMQWESILGYDIQINGKYVLNSHAASVQVPKRGRTTLLPFYRNIKLRTCGPLTGTRWVCSWSQENAVHIIAQPSSPDNVDAPIIGWAVTCE